jgi:hypothetical protein
MNIKNSYFLVFFIFSFFMNCEEQNANFPEGSDELLKLELSEANSYVGTKNPIQITAYMTKDAEGETCTFTASAGGFKTYSDKLQDQQAIVDVYGQASAFWFPPNDPSNSVISVTVKTVSKDTIITVLPVGAINFSNDFQGVYSADSTFIITIEINPLWSSLPVEVNVSQGSLNVLGPVSNGFSNGTRVLPIIDQTGKIQIQYKTPLDSTSSTIVASLFGTLNSQIIKGIKN